jgi:hypothetical protein
MGCLVREFASIIFETLIEGSTHYMAEVTVLLDGHSLVQCHGNAKCF